MRPRKYGSRTLQHGLKLLEEQNFNCAICRRKIKFLGINDHGRMMAVDHCHWTGLIRGVLCSQCNSGLGQFGDDPAVLARAILYLTHLPQRVAGFEDGVRYVPIWPIYCGDRTESQIPRYLMDLEREDFDKAMVKAANQRAVLEQADAIA